jgi:hypothetical protein
LVFPFLFVIAGMIVAIVAWTTWMNELVGILCVTIPFGFFFFLYVSSPPTTVPRLILTCRFEVSWWLLFVDVHNFIASTRNAGPTAHG